MIIIKFPARKEAINGEAKRDIKMKIITQAQHVRKLRHCQDGAKLLTLSVSQFAKVLAAVKIRTWQKRKQDSKLYILQRHHCPQVKDNLWPISKRHLSRLTNHRIVHDILKRRQS